MIAVAPGDWHPVATPPAEVVARARVGCGWRIVAPGRWWLWTGLVAGVGWGLYVDRLTGPWRGYAFRTEAVPAQIAPEED